MFRSIILSAAIVACLSIAASAQSLGVPACDEFIVKFETCVKKQPEAQSAALNQAVTQMRTSWKSLADNPQTKPALEQACKQVTEAMKPQLNAAPYSCGF
jgi:uncharacterized protein YecT (DUF1311 family)